MATTFDRQTQKVGRQEALDYHSAWPRGKIEVVPTKPVATARQLTLAYSPGVAEPCLVIAEDRDLSYKYTARGNLVGVITNGTAVLGLGDIGPWAAKPVMEGKGVLFKKFADIDVFDLEVNAKDYILAFKHGLKLFADCTVIGDPTAEQLADIAISTAELAREFELTPRVAMLSYSNFGTDRGGSPGKVRRALELVRQRRPELEIDGEMQVDPRWWRACASRSSRSCGSPATPTCSSSPT